MAGKNNKLAKGRISVSTQQYLDIAEIKDDVVVMKDGTVRAVLLVSSINFALKSEEEQNAIVSSYVGFLNNINFPVQIVIQSRKLNIENYVEELKKMEKEQTNELLKVQTKEYIEYIQELVSLGDIMTKSFYVIIPYNPLSDKHKSFWSSLMESFRPVSLVQMKGKRFDRYKDELERRVENITSALGSASLNSVRLDTQGLIELYYNTYNPDTSGNQKLADVKDIKVGA
ncbi:TraC family protein [Candidatus Falkowbacteria bacterium]|nr:TraC family protein [Candidatus Falkowbacteria bacterium]